MPVPSNKIFLIEIITFLSFLLYAISLTAQDSSLNEKSFRWNIFLDNYYSYDFNKPYNHEKPSFIYNHKRHNEFNINLALIKGSYNTDQVRANLGLMAGTYPEYNLAVEPGLLRHIYEANIGTKIFKQTNLWIDAGVFPSHIGFETAISKDCQTLTRSVLAENSPYYEAGIRGSYNSQNEKWYLAVLLLNGWQHIKRVDGNNTIAFGTQVSFTPSDKVLINSSSFIGNDKPDSVKRMRYFHNLFSVFQLSKYWNLTFGFDTGVEQKEKGSSKLNSWYAPILIVQYKPAPKWAFALRAENYTDKNGVIVPLVFSEPLQINGLSANTDFYIANNLLWRIEGRWLKNKRPYFFKQSVLVTSNTSFSTSLSIAIN